MTDFLAYWTTDQLSQALRRGTLPHAASGQFSRVSLGDRVWICGRLNGAPELFTIGFIDVASNLGERAAQAEMRRRDAEYTVWDAPRHILPRPGNECETRVLSLRSLYTALAFESKGSPRLVLARGHPNSQQLQTMRQLTPIAARVLRDHWLSSLRAVELQDADSPRTFDLDVLDSQRQALARLEQSAARAFVLRGQRTASCAFCGRILPASLLVAAHIKPRSSCTVEEKRQIENNILGLCSLGCDDLFERGYAEVFDGVVVAGSAEPVTTAVSDAVSRIANRSVQGWTVQREAFFRWRRDNRPKGAT